MTERPTLSTPRRRGAPIVKLAEPGQTITGSLIHTYEAAVYVDGVAQHWDDGRPKTDPAVYLITHKGSTAHVVRWDEQAQAWTPGVVTAGEIVRLVFDYPRSKAWKEAAGGKALQVGDAVAVTRAADSHQRLDGKPATIPRHVWDITVTRVPDGHPSIARAVEAHHELIAELDTHTPDPRPDLTPTATPTATPNADPFADAEPW